MSKLIKWLYTPICTFQPLDIPNLYAHFPDILFLIPLRDCHLQDLNLLFDGLPIPNTLILLYSTLDDREAKSNWRMHSLSDLSLKSQVIFMHVDSADDLIDTINDHKETFCQNMKRRSQVVFFSPRNIVSRIYRHTDGRLEESTTLGTPEISRIFRSKAFPIDSIYEFYVWWAIQSGILDSVLFDNLRAKALPMINSRKRWFQPSSLLKMISSTLLKFNNDILNIYLIAIVNSFVVDGRLALPRNSEPSNSLDIRYQVQQDVSDSKVDPPVSLEHPVICIDDEEVDDTSWTAQLKAFIAKQYPKAESPFYAIETIPRKASDTSDSDTDPIFVACVHVVGMKFLSNVPCNYEEAARNNAARLAHEYFHQYLSVVTNMNTSANTLAEFEFEYSDELRLSKL